MKECNRCHEIKPKTEFHKRGNFQQHICKLCKKIEDHKRNLKNKKKTKVSLEIKTCPTCGITYPASEFHKNIYKPDGLSTQCPKCKSDLNKYGSRIRTSEKWHMENLRKHRESKKRSDAKRRDLGSEMLNEWREGWDGHHINKLYIIFMPHYLHKSIQHNVWTGKNMEEINELAFKFL